MKMSRREAEALLIAAAPYRKSADIADKCHALAVFMSSRAGIVILAAAELSGARFLELVLSGAVLADDLASATASVPALVDALQQLVDAFLEGARRIDAAQCVSAVPTAVQDAAAAAIAAAAKVKDEGAAP